MFSGGYRKATLGSNGLKVNLVTGSKRNIRISRPEVFCKKGVLRKIAKFTGKPLCQSLFFIKSAGLRPEISKSTFFHRTPLVAASGTQKGS